MYGTGARTNNPPPSLSLPLRVPPSHMHSPSSTPAPRSKPPLFFLPPLTRTAGKSIITHVAAAFPMPPPPPPACCPLLRPPSPPPGNGVINHSRWSRFPGGIDASPSALRPKRPWRGVGGCGANSTVPSTEQQKSEEPAEENGAGERDRLAPRPTDRSTFFFAKEPLRFLLLPSSFACMPRKWEGKGDLGGGRGLLQTEAAAMHRAGGRSLSCTDRPDHDTFASFT